MTKKIENLIEKPGKRTGGLFKKKGPFDLHASIHETLKQVKTLKQEAIDRGLIKKEGIEELEKEIMDEIRKQKTKI